MNTTKKIISLLMCLLMVMSIIPVSASAAGKPMPIVILNINCEDLKNTVPGSIAPSKDFFTVTTGYKIDEVSYKKNSSGSEVSSGVVLPEGEYTVKIKVSRTDGSALSDDINARINGISADEIEHKSTYVIFSHIITVAYKEITDISLYVSNYTAGGDITAFSVSTDTEGLCFKGTGYYSDYAVMAGTEDSHIYLEEGKFGCDTHYWFDVDLYLEDGYKFADSFSSGHITIDTPYDDCEIKYQDNEKVVIKVRLSDLFVSEITDVFFTLGNYTAGDKLNQVGLTPISPGVCYENRVYQYGSPYWFTDFGETTNKIDGENTFIAGETYWLFIVIEAEDGYVFAEDIDATHIHLDEKRSANVVYFDSENRKQLNVRIELEPLSVQTVNRVVINVPDPVVGKSPSLSDVTATEGIKIESIEWEDSEGNVLGATDVFRERQTYSYTVVFTGMPGYNIAINATYQLNEYDVFAYDVPEAPAKKYVDGSADTFTHIESIGVSFDGYEAGKKITDIALNFTTEGVKLIQDGYLLNDYGGYYVSDDASGDKIITDGTFEIGKKYYIQLCLVPENNYYKFDTFISSCIMVPAGCSAINFGKISDQVFFTIELPVLEHECGNYLDYVKGEAAECLNDGTIAHYICTYTSCGKKYSDDKATNEITDTVISAPGHNFMMTFPKVDASCGAEGRKEAFRVCKRCNNKYSLTDENTPLTDAYIESIRIPATGAHTYDNDCDTECNECFAARTIAHTYDNACDAECNVCKTSRTPAAHKGGTATCKVKAKCSVCGSEYGSLKADNHKNITVLKAVAATYKADGKTEGKKCADCGTVTVPQKTVAKKVLGKVTGLKVKAVKLASGTKTTLTLAWNKVEGAEAYEIEQRVGKTWKYVGTTKKTSLTVKKLKANKSYKFRVRAVIDGATPGTYSKTFTAKTVPLKTTLTLKAGKKALTASWKTVANITGYEVQYSTSKKFTKKTTKTVTIKKAKTKKTTIKKLSKGKKYYVKVRAYKTVGKTKVYSAWSSIKTVKVK